MNSFFTIVGTLLGFAAVFSQAPPVEVDYFPVGVFAVPSLMQQMDRKLDDMNRKADERTRGWISSELRKMDEPSLWEVSQKQKREGYRFVWLRSFDQPVAIRLKINEDESGDLVAKVLSGATGDDSGHLVTDKRSHLPPVEARSFIEKLSKANFWTLPTTRTERVYGRDGAEWIMEGTKDGTYHVVERWSPRDGAYRDACLYLALGLAELKIPDREIY